MSKTTFIYIFLFLYCIGKIKVFEYTIQITLLSYDGEELAKLTGVINSLEPGETAELNIATTSNYITAYDYRIEEK